MDFIFLKVITKGINTNDKYGTVFNKLEET